MASKDKPAPFAPDDKTPAPPAEDKPRFPSAPTDADGGPPPTTPGLPPAVAPRVRTEAEEAEAARLSREAADSPIGTAGKNLLAVFSPQAVASALKIATGDAERLIDVVLVKTGRGSAEERAQDLVKAIARVAHGESVDDVLRERG